MAECLLGHEVRRTVIVIDDDIATYKAISRVGRTGGFITAALTREQCASGSVSEPLGVPQGGLCMVIDAKSFAACLTVFTRGVLSEVPKIIIGVPRSLAALAELFGTVNGRLIEKPFSLAKIAEVIDAAFANLQNSRSDRAERSEIGRRFNALTEREQQVGVLIANGLSNLEVSDMLNISVRTVKAHRAKVMEKTCSSSLADYVRQYQVFVSGGRWTQ